jgi:hypothetical protein
LFIIGAAFQQIKEALFSNNPKITRSKNALVNQFTLRVGKNQRGPRASRLDP